MQTKKVIFAEALLLSVRDDPEIDGKNFARFKEHIDNAPDAVKHGRWIDKREIPSYSNKNIPVVECSKCRCLFCDIINVHSFMYHYCPNCGAKMDGGNDDG